MVFKKSFTLLVATATTPFFSFVLIIFEQYCRFGYIFIFSSYLIFIQESCGVVDIT